MKIRSITYFLNPGSTIDKMAVDHAGRFVAEARSILKTSGYEVQTLRLATTPFSELLPSMERDQAVEYAVEMENRAVKSGFEYLSLGPAPADYLASFAVIPNILEHTQNTFLAGMMTKQKSELSLPAVRACAEIMHKAGQITPDGFTNLRFAALACVPSGAPFFPAAYHQGNEPNFALATEAADLAVEAFRSGKSLVEARDRLRFAIEEHARELTQVSKELSDRYNVPFGGIDFTLAPFPEESLSIGSALESLGVPMIGMHGSLAAAAILTDTLARASFPRAGFNGLFLPVLEDAVLARRADQQVLTLKDLLLYSTVCGTGLDTIPLPGDTTVEQIYAVLFDLAALSLRLSKPLTARLMPIPDKKVGDPVHFDFPYFADSRILAIESTPLSGHMRENVTIKMGSHSPGNIS